MNIYLGKHFEEFIRKQVESGRYANASEVVREALRFHEINEIKRERLRAKLAEADADFERGDVIEVTDVRAFIEEVVSAPVLVVLSGDPRPDGKRVSDVLGALAQPITLGPLGAREIAALAAQRLFGLELPPPALHRLVEDSTGMPSLVERTLARLVVDQTVQRRGATGGVEGRGQVLHFGHRRYLTTQGSGESLRGDVQPGCRRYRTHD